MHMYLFLPSWPNRTVVRFRSIISTEFVRLIPLLRTRMSKNWSNNKRPLMNLIRICVNAQEAPMDPSLFVRRCRVLGYIRIGGFLGSALNFANILKYTIVLLEMCLLMFHLCYPKVSTNSESSSQSMSSVLQAANGRFS